MILHDKFFSSTFTSIISLYFFCSQVYPKALHGIECFDAID